MNGPAVSAIHCYGDIISCFICNHNIALVQLSRFIVSFHSIFEIFLYDCRAGGLFWSRTARLIPRDQTIDANFGERVALYDNTIAITAKNDNRGDAIATVLTVSGEAQFNTGSAYIFTGRSDVCHGYFFFLFCFDSAEVCRLKITPNLHTILILFSLFAY